MWVKVPMQTTVFMKEPRRKEEETRMTHMDPADEYPEHELSYDPLAEDAGFVEDDDEEEVAFVGLVERPSETDEVAEKEPVLTPEERVRHLLDSIPAQRKVMLSIIDFCRSPRSPVAVDELTAELQRLSPSIYTAVLLRQHLQNAGALEYLEPDKPKDEVGAGEADMDGTQMVSGDEAAFPAEEGGEIPPIAYLEVTRRPEGTWISTTVALSVYDSVNPLADLKRAIEEEPEYKEIFVRILRYCDAETRTKRQIDALVDNDPLLVGPPRIYGGHFVGLLDECGGLTWCPNWGTSEVGRAFLEDYDRTDGCAAIQWAFDSQGGGESA
jgi:hypothetical protein